MKELSCYTIGYRNLVFPCHCSKLYNFVLCSVWDECRQFDQIELTRYSSEKIYLLQGYSDICFCDSLKDPVYETFFTQLFKILTFAMNNLCNSPSLTDEQKYMMRLLHLVNFLELTYMYFQEKKYYICHIARKETGFSIEFSQAKMHFFLALLKPET